MSRIITLTENDISKIVKRVLFENKKIQLLKEGTDPKLTFYGPGKSKDAKVLWETVGVSNGGTVSTNIGKFQQIYDNVNYRNKHMIYQVSYTSSKTMYEKCVISRYPDFTGTVEIRKEDCKKAGGYWKKDENRCSINLGEVKEWDETCKEKYLNFDKNLRVGRFNACLKTIKNSPLLMGMPFSIEQKNNVQYADDDAEHWFESMSTVPNGTYKVAFFFNDNDSCTYKGFNYLLDTGGYDLEEIALKPLKGALVDTKPKPKTPTNIYNGYPTKEAYLKAMQAKLKQKTEKKLTKDECISGGKEWSDEDQACYDLPEVEIVGTKKNKSEKQPPKTSQELETTVNKNDKQNQTNNNIIDDKIKTGSKNLDKSGVDANNKNGDKFATPGSSKGGGDSKNVRLFLSGPQ